MSEPPLPLEAIQRGLLEGEALGREASAKGRGYGRPRLVQLPWGQTVVFHRSRRGPFGREYLADGAHTEVLAFETFDELPAHVRALDVGAVLADGSLRSIAGAQAFYLITSYGEGVPYFRLLEAAVEREAASADDLRKADVLVESLATIHAVRRDEPELYRRKSRELVGGNECIAGILDSYDDFPLDGWGSSEQLLSIERRCLGWRHRLKGFTHRLRRVHGDFHPWNLLFDGDRLTLLDRSRGPYGEPADDVAALVVNYLFFSLLGHGRLQGALRELWFHVFSTYLHRTGDEELLQTLPPHLAFRALVVASPAWYPDLPATTRRALLSFAERVLGEADFEPERIDELLAG